MKTTTAVIGRWPEVFKAFGLPPVTGKNHFKGECPVCGKTGKYRCDDQNGRGTWICSCGNGDGWSLLTRTQQKTIRELYDEVDRIIGNNYSHTDNNQVQQTEPDKISRRHDSVMRRFGTLVPLRGTDGERYLQRRGINVLPSPDAVRYEKNQALRTGGAFQALWSLVTDSQSRACYLHRTLLDGDKKAPVTETKKAWKLQEDSVLSHSESQAIRLFPVASTLGIAEGIETALSCKQVYQINTWSVVNADLMKKFRVPAGVKHLVIFADMDPNSATGHAAAFACAHSNILAKNDLLSVSVRWCDSGDFNDFLINGDQVRELTFTKKVAA
ncbi:DNA primase [Salmonella enterica]|nr:DNA primase [Salmonella enterica]EIW3445135.1 toprim domain-containing protein [Salmonella enterica]